MLPLWGVMVADKAWYVAVSLKSEVVSGKFLFC